MRADSELFKRKLARSRSAAAELIRRGSVKLNGKTLKKASDEVRPEDILEIGEGLPFVSRAGEKLDYALRHFSIDVHGKSAIDVGSSTGGFTDCLLRHGVKSVHAIDVGTDQLVEALRSDPRVTVMEQTDIRDVTLDIKSDLAVIDVSFISLQKVLPKVHELLTQGGLVIALIKPQFEVGKGKLNKKGIVKESKDREESAENVLAIAGGIGFTLKGFAQSPLQGGDGNIEYLAYLKAD
jgi:23S rRNA (cytidine1920-2'-O)/16S rRNA (cytidine1409-2'-O)-methyltransferase